MFKSLLRICHVLVFFLQKDMIINNKAKEACRGGGLIHDVLHL